MESIGRLRDAVITVESKEQNDDTRIDAPRSIQSRELWQAVCLIQ